MTLSVTCFRHLCGWPVDFVPVEHARRLVAALHAAKVEVIYGEYPQADHGLTMAWGFSGPWAQVFLGRHLHPLW